MFRQQTGPRRTSVTLHERVSSYSRSSPHPARIYVPFDEVRDILDTDGDFDYDEDDDVDIGPSREELAAIDESHGLPRYKWLTRLLNAQRTAQDEAAQDIQEDEDTHTQLYDTNLDVETLQDALNTDIVAEFTEQRQLTAMEQPEPIVLWDHMLELQDRDAGDSVDSHDEDDSDWFEINEVDANDSSLDADIEIVKLDNVIIAQSLIYHWELTHAQALKDSKTNPEKLRDLVGQMDDSLNDADDEASGSDMEHHHRPTKCIETGYFSPIPCSSG